MGKQPKAATCFELKVELTGCPASRMKSRKHSTGDAAPLSSFNEANEES